MKRVIFTILFAAAIGGCGQTSVFEPDYSDAFGRIETGIAAGSSRVRVVELMGTPVERSYRDVFGVSYERMKFKDGRRAYTVTLINGMAVSKSAEDLLH